MDTFSLMDTSSKNLYFDANLANCFICVHIDGYFFAMSGLALAGIQTPCLGKFHHRLTSSVQFDLKMRNGIKSEIILCRGRVAQLVERPSKVPVRCNSTDWRGFESRERHDISSLSAYAAV